MSRRSRWARNARMPLLVGLFVASIALGATWGLTHQPGPPQALPAVAMVPSRAVFAVSTGAAHPHGPDETPTRSRTPWSGPGLIAMWHGGGRHPVWRGCQHVYDPALSKFIFSRPRPSS